MFQVKVHPFWGTEVNVDEHVGEDVVTSLQERQILACRSFYDEVDAYGLNIVDVDDELNATYEKTRIHVNGDLEVFAFSLKLQQGGVRVVRGIDEQGQYFEF